MSDTKRTLRNVNLASAMNRMNRVLQGAGGTDVLLAVVGGAVVVIGLLGVGNAASKLSVRAEHRAEEKCGFKSSDIIELVQSLLVAAIGVLVVRKSMI